MTSTIQNEFLTVTVATLGAELQSIRDAEGVEYLWQGDPAYWKGRAPNLFPYVARLTGGVYELDGQEYAMRIHGFTPVTEFIVAENDGGRLVMELTANDDTRPVYPREFVFRVIYALQKNVLAVTYEVTNRDEKVMYFGLGAHPGFNVPLREGKRFEDYRLRFGAPCRPRKVEFTDDCFVSGVETDYPLEGDRDLPLRHDLFDHDAVVLRGTPHQVTIETEGDSRSVTVTYPQMDNVGFWHKPVTDAPYVCVEPWCSLPSAAGKKTVFEEKADLLTLEPGGVYRNDWTIEIRS